jgi:HD-like signal output (HDOD) protein
MSVSVTDQELAVVVEQLPPVSSVMQRLLSVLRDPLSEVSDISKLVRVDTALAAQILRLANSPFYGLAEQVASVDQAIQHVGVNEITRLITTLSARQLFQKALTRYKLAPHLVWTHTLAVAVGAEVVAERIFGDVEITYLAGMLHTIGFVALDGVATTRNLGPRRPDVPLLEWEKENFAATNAEIAARVLHHWNFPAAIVEAVGARYAEPTVESIVQPAGLLYAASYFAERVPAGLPPEAGMFTAPTKALEAFMVRPAEMRELEFAIRDKLSRLRSMLNLV